MRGTARKRLWAVAGFASFALGALGAVLPLLPTTPFLLLAALCFSRSSTKADQWFKNTRLYREVLLSYTGKRAMTVAQKAKILVPVTVLLGVSFILMSNVLAGRIVVGIVWVAHLVFFGFFVKTKRRARPSAEPVEAL